jgi:hypothetical protein
MQAKIKRDNMNLLLPIKYSVKEQANKEAD